MSQQNTGSHGYPAPHYGYPYQPQPSNGIGTAGMVCGIVGLVLCALPFVGLFTFPVAVVGLVLSGIGVGKANRGEATNRGAAIAGVTCSSIAVVLFVLWVVYIATMPTWL